MPIIETEAVAGGIRVLRLNRPPSNMLNLELLEAVGREARRAETDSETRCLVLASSLPRYFSAGLDLAAFEGNGQGRSAPFLALLDAFDAWRELSKPTLAAIGGSAVLGGWILAMACDWRIISEDGKVALSEVRLGLSPTTMLIRRLAAVAKDPTAVKEMVLKGRSLRATEALAAGLVDRTVPADALAGESLREAKTLARLPGHAYALIKRALWPPDAAGRAASEKEFTEIMAHPLTQEGMAA